MTAEQPIINRFTDFDRRLIRFIYSRCSALPSAGIEGARRAPAGGIRSDSCMARSAVFLGDDCLITTRTLVAGESKRGCVRGDVVAMRGRVFLYVIGTVRRTTAARELGARHRRRMGRQHATPPVAAETGAVCALAHHRAAPSARLMPRRAPADALGSGSCTGDPVDRRLTTAARVRACLRIAE